MRDFAVHWQKKHRNSLLIHYHSIWGRCSKVTVFILFEKNKHGNFDNTYEWCASKVSPSEKILLRNIPPETMGTWIPTFQKGESIIIRNVNEIVSYDPTVYENTDTAKHCAPYCQPYLP